MVGLKATYGRISSHGSFPLDWSVGHLGPIGATVEDVALAYAAMAGGDVRDAATLGQPALGLRGWPVDRATADLSSLRLGIYPEWFDHADPEVVDCCRAMLDQLIACGATLREFEMPELDELRLAHGITILSEMAASMANYAEHWNDLSPSTRISLAMGKGVTSVDYLQSQRLRTRSMARFAEVLRDVDVIVTPATAIVAPALSPASLSHGVADMNVVSQLMRFVFPANMTGLPAITFPVGYSNSGLPIAMQAMGRPWEEGLLLSVAAEIEKLTQHKLPDKYWDLGA